MLLNYNEEFKASICLPNWRSVFKAAVKPFSPLMTIALIFAYLIIDAVLVIIDLQSSSHHKTCYGGHGFGILGGFIVGIIVLDNRVVEKWENILRKVLLYLFSATCLTMLVMHFTFLTEENHGGNITRNHGLPEPCWDCWKAKWSGTYNVTIKGDPLGCK